MDKKTNGNNYVAENKKADIDFFEYFKDTQKKPKEKGKFGRENKNEGMKLIEEILKQCSDKEFQQTIKDYLAKHEPYDTSKPLRIKG